MELITIASATAAAGLLVGGASRLAIAGWRRASDELQQFRMRSQVQSELEYQTLRARLAGRSKWQNEHNTRSQWRVMQVVEVVDESEDVRSFYLRDPLAPAGLPTYRPGQFLIIRPALGGAELPARCYSLSDAPNPNWYRISIKRQRRNVRHQLSLSNWLHENVGVGDCLLVAGPHGDFTLPESLRDDAPVVLMAAGVGITPILSMLKSLLMANASRSISLIFQVPDLDHWPFGELLHSWGKQCPGLKVSTFFSRLSHEQLPQVESGHVYAGKANLDIIDNQALGQASTHYLMCGPAQWMKDWQLVLTEAGVSDEQIHWEAFTNPDAEDQTTVESAIGDWDIRFARSGVSTAPTDKPATVLQAALEHGLTLPAACHSGACGTCKLKLLKGAIKYATSPTCQHGPDEVVACVAQAVGSIEVDA